MSPKRNSSRDESSFFVFHRSAGTAGKALYMPFIYLLIIRICFIFIRGILIVKLDPPLFFLFPLKFLYMLKIYTLEGTFILSFFIKTQTRRTPVEITGVLNFSVYIVRKALYIEKRIVERNFYEIILKHAYL